MATKLVSVSTMQKGKYIVIDGVACKVMGTQTSRPGKHGHAKVRVEAVGLLDGRKREIVMPGHDNIETPIIEKRNAQVLSISGKSANVMDTETYETFDLEIPDDIQDKIKDGIVILYWDVLGQKVMKDSKGGSDED